MLGKRMEAASTFTGPVDQGLCRKTTDDTDDTHRSKPGGLIHGECAQGTRRACIRVIRVIRGSWPLANCRFSV